MILQLAAAAMGSQPGVNLNWGGVSDIDLGGAGASCSVTLNRDGTAETTGNASTTPPSNNWVSPKTPTIGDGYEVQWQVNSGNTPTGSATGSWISLDTDRSWAYVVVGVGDQSGSHTISVRRAGTTTTLASYTFAMDAASSSGGA